MAFARCTPLQPPQRRARVSLKFKRPYVPTVNWAPSAALTLTLAAQLAALATVRQVRRVQRLALPSLSHRFAVAGLVEIGAVLIQMKVARKTTPRRPTISGRRLQQHRITAATHTTAVHIAAAHTTANHIPAALFLVVAEPVTTLATTLATIRAQAQAQPAMPTAPPRALAAQRSTHRLGLGELGAQMELTSLPTVGAQIDTKN